MLNDKFTLRKLEKKSDDVKVLHAPWLTTSRTRCTLRDWSLLPKVPLLRQSKLIFQDSYSLPNWSAGITFERVRVCSKKASIARSRIVSGV